MGWKNKVGKSLGSKKGSTPPYFVPGRYDKLEVLEVKEFKNNNDDDCVAVNFLIHESDVGDRPAGTKVGDVWNLSRDKFDYAPDEICSMLAAVLGVHPSEVDEATCDEAVSTNNPAAGRFVSAVATAKHREGKTPLTLVEYFPVPEEQQERRLAS